MNRFEGRRVLVTGAASGIGEATAVRLHEEGAEVVAADVSPVTITGDRITAVTLDVSNEAQVNEVVGGLDPLDVLINAAGILRAGHTHEFSLEGWNQIIGINLTGTFLVCRAALPALCASGHGVICNFSSTAARFAHPYMAAYAASKGGIDAFTHTLSAEYSKSGLRAFNVQPGGIESGITATTGGMLPTDTDWSLFAKTSPVLQPNASGFAGPEAIAGVIASLASDDGKWVTGTDIRIDGGAHG
ncbi:MAG: putative oxidoreductase [Actinomycetia bacterium]|nr:putative oxidoreductase [Actinomycetes bacterium]